MRFASFAASWLCCLVGLVLLTPAVGHSEDLSSKAELGTAARPIRALLVTGGCCHDYDMQKLIIPRGVSARANVVWTVVHQGGAGTAAEIPLYRDPNWADGFDVVVHNECFADDKDPAWCERILKPHKEGKPAVLIHCTMHCYRVGTDAWFEFCGVQSPGHGPHYAYTVDNKAMNHPIMKGFGEAWTVPAGELYDTPKIFPTATPLATANRQPDGVPQTCIWTNDYKGTRVFATTIGHYNQTMATDKYLDMLTRGLLWSVLGDKAPDIKEDSEVADKELADLLVQGAPKTDAQATRCCGEDNLAFEKPATASSEETSKNNFAKNATDGELQSRWCANGPGESEFLQIDMGAPQDIRWLRLHWESGNNAYRYKIDSSPDAKQWTTVVDASNNQKPEQVVAHEVNLKAARFVRVTYLGSSAGGWGSIWEVEAYAGELPKLVTSATSSANVHDVKAPAGFDVKVFAAPPEVNYPVCLTTSATGEVFVGIDEQGSLGKDKGRGRVVRCVDVDGDGKADDIKTFATMDHPRGLIYDNHQLWVLHPPTLSLFIDHDKDGVSDEQKTLISGISTDQVAQRGADHTTNGIRMGIDGWIYIAVGDFGFNEAKGADGRILRKRGGGVVRVRPDGSDMEIYSWGQRNILDVCIDPQLNMFTRDNTNDGGGWNVRVTHLHQGGNYGYPSRYINFAEETMPPLADYGGGSGCGAMYHYDPRWPAGFESAALTCDWGTSKVYRHRPSMVGASYSADQDDFLTLPRPTDIDVDPSGRMFVSSWKNGNFSFTGPDVGFVALVQPTEMVAKPLPALNELSVEEIIKLLPSAGSATLFHTQQELLRRKAEVVQPLLTKLILDPSAGIPARVAAIFTLKQMQGAAANEFLASVAFVPSAIQEFALRALTDRLDESKGIEVAKMIDALASDNPRVRAQALISIRRLALAGTLSPMEREQLTGKVLAYSVVRNADGTVRTERVPHDKGDEARVIPVLAVETLISLNAAPALVEATEGELRSGALMAMRQIHSREVVDAVLAKMAKTYDLKPRMEWLEVLARLYYQEGDYIKSDWWGTRPDTRGPYYDRVSWDQTDRIKQVLIQAYASTNAETRPAFDAMLERYQISLGQSDTAMKAILPTDKPIVIAKADPNNPNQIGNLDRAVAMTQATETKGSAEAGKALFVSQACIACHTYADGQTPQGPHLVDIGKRYSRKELVESVLEPNAKIAQGFDSWTVLTVDGKVQTGFVVLESAETLTLRGADGRRVEILQDDIDDRRKQEQSMMPKGLVDNLTTSQLADLMAYLESLH
jgi:putative membrane-bound dehydrogenase-like protein